MKIVAVSNPKFVGVTVASKSYSNQYIPFNPDIAKPAAILTQIMVANPDVLIIGGWGEGFQHLLNCIPKREHRSFAVIIGWHGTHFHDAFMADSHYFDQAIAAYREGRADYFGFAHIDMARYFHSVLCMRALWLPHAFRIHPQVKKQEQFTIGVFGGTPGWKSVAGQRRIVRDFCERHPGTGFIDKYDLKMGRDWFNDLLRTCSMISHLSLLECYPNVVLEAWSNGIPAIIGTASATLINNPLVNSPHRKAQMRGLLLRSSINSLEFYSCLEKVHANWNYYSDMVYDYYGHLHHETQQYLKEAFVKICESFTSRKTQLPELPTICTELLLSTAEYNQGTSQPQGAMDRGFSAAT